MARAWCQVTLHWRDSTGKTYDVTWSIQDQTDAVPAPLIALGEELQACSAAHLDGISYTTFHPIAGEPAGVSAHPSVWDQLSLIGRCTGGTSYPRLRIPAPLDECFDETGKAVLDAAPLDSAIAQIEATVGVDETHPIESVDNPRLIWGGPTDE